MKLTVSRSKNSESFYITKSFRDPDSGRPTAKVVERLGTRAELEERLGPLVDVVEWGRERARRLTEAEKESGRAVARSYSPARRIERGRRRLFGAGHLFLQAACAEAGLDAICKGVAKRHGFAFDLSQILSHLVYGRVLEPASKRATCAFAGTLVGRPSLEAHQVYRALEVLARENDFVQAELYKNTAKALGRKTGVLYYDCTNYFFEIGQEDGFRRYGLSKEHRPNPIVQMGLFMDAEGMPLAFSMFPGNESEQASMTPLEEAIARDFKLSRFVTCTDAGPSSLANRRFNTQGERQFVTTQSIKKLKGHLRAWALDPRGWSAKGAPGSFDLSEVAGAYDGGEDAGARSALRGLTFYKRRRVKERDPRSEGGWFEQELIVTFSLKHRDYQRRVRGAQIDRALKAMEKGPSRMARKGASDFRRLCKMTAVTAEGELADAAVWTLDERAVAEEARYDGFYALCTSLEDDDVEGVLAVNARRWEIEECFRIMKTEFKARPVCLSRQDRIRAHFLTCFIALLAFRIVERKLDADYTCEQIVDALRSMQMERIRGEGWAPMYERTEITDALHDAFGFRTDYEIITDASMRKIIRQTKKK